MSDTNTVEYKTNPTTTEKYVQKDGTFRVYLIEFGGQFDGLHYHAPQFEPDVSDTATDEEKNTAASSALNDAVAKYGAWKVNYLFNNALLGNVRTKVLNSRIPKYEDKAANEAAIKKMVAETPEVFTLEDAENFMPGEREISYAGYMNLAKKARAEKRFDDMKNFMLKAMEIAEREQAMAGV